LIISGITKQVLLDTESTTVVLESCAPNDWFKLNPGFQGFYRVQYTPEDLALLRPAIESKVLGEVDRLNLLNDTFALVQAGKVTTTFYLDLIQVMRTLLSEG
jgi:aminopeptidase N